MAKVKTNPIIEEIRGAVGDLVFRNSEGKTVVSRKPDLSGIEPTEAQQNQRERFGQAALYGKLVLADEEAKAVYEAEAGKKHKPVFSLMVADFLNAPQVDEVDVSGYSGQAGDVITVRAHDDFEVTGVTINIMNSDGESIESGEAEKPTAGNSHWTYTVTQAVAAGTTVRVAVTATDRPGGTGILEQEKSL